PTLRRAEGAPAAPVRGECPITAPGVLRTHPRRAGRCPARRPGELPCEDAVMGTGDAGPEPGACGGRRPGRTARAGRPRARAGPGTRKGRLRRGTAPPRPPPPARGTGPGPAPSVCGLLPVEEVLDASADLVRGEAADRQGGPAAQHVVRRLRPLVVAGPDDLRPDLRGV